MNTLNCSNNLGWADRQHIGRRCRDKEDRTLRLQDICSRHQASPDTHMSKCSRSGVLKKLDQKRDCHWTVHSSRCKWKINYRKNSETNRVQLRKALYDLPQKWILGQKTLTIRIANQCDQQSAPHANPSCICLEAVSCVICSYEPRIKETWQTLVLGRSENRWLKGWKKVISLFPHLETLIASSSRLGFSSGPSIRFETISKFHLVWSFVSITC